jgi:5-methylcytosine-specific restriction endonuclease McrA
LSNINRDSFDHSQYELSRYKAIRIKAIIHLGGKCIKCGSTDLLEFDHIDPSNKKYNVSEIWSTTGIFWNELEKCQILCFSCHKEKTSLENIVHNRWRYENHKCRCLECVTDYKLYRRQRYLRRGD